MLTQEQVKDLKEQLKSQVQNLPETQKQEALKQIEELSAQSLEIMIKQQQEKNISRKDSQKPEKTIFRMIVDKEVPAEIIDENAQALAVLEINPISKGHLMILPKKPAITSKEIPTQAFTIAKKLSKKIISKLKAVSTEIQTEFKFNETIINVIPVYDKPLSLSSPRHKASKEELEELSAKLKVRKKQKITKIKMNKSSSPTPVLKWHRKIP